MMTSTKQEEQQQRAASLEVRQIQTSANDNNDAVEVDAGVDSGIQLTDQSFETIGEDGDHDMESLLPTQSTRNAPIHTKNGLDAATSSSSPMTPLELHMNSSTTTTTTISGNNDDEDSDLAAANRPLRITYLGGGMLKPYSVGNIQILFPDYFHSSGWGVLGPHWFGPTCVWLILVGATHLCIKAVYRRNLGMISIVICYLFLALCTHRLTDVSLRDPGIVLDKEIPSHVPPDRVYQYRFCDRCQVWQPPDGVHCPECNVCVSGYDHHCVWMGTCIGKRNYRQFVLFNMSWLYYVGYLFFWILTFGPLFIKP
jgi:DHHC palmitoyltransferase